MQLSARRGIGEIITAQNYVGMIAMKDGTVIEILPKIWSREEEQTDRTKKLLIDMLRTLKTAPYKNLQTAGVNVAKLDIFDLFDEPKRFSMRPAIVVRNRKDGSCFILDTKWKVLSEAKFNYGIAQTDMYQMYAYQHKYQANNVRLVYPMTSYLLPEDPISYRADDAEVNVEFVDLYNVNDSKVTCG